MKRSHERRCRLAFRWPEPPLHVVLVEPEIPPNTGNVARLCAATGSVLHLIEPMGFEITNARLRRAGLDYWDSVPVFRHANFDAFLSAARPARLFFFSTGATRSFHEATFRPGDALVFGNESHGLSDTLLARYADHTLGIPVRGDHVRSLNLSSSVAVAVYEALRQIQSAREPSSNVNATDGSFV